MAMVLARWPVLRFSNVVTARAGKDIGLSITGNEN